MVILFTTAPVLPAARRSTISSGRRRRQGSRAPEAADSLRARDTTLYPWGRTRSAPSSHQSCRATPSTPRNSPLTPRYLSLQVPSVPLQRDIRPVKVGAFLCFGFGLPYPVSGFSRPSIFSSPPVHPKLPHQVPSCPAPAPHHSLKDPWTREKQGGRLTQSPAGRAAPEKKKWPQALPNTLATCPTTHHLP